MSSLPDFTPPQTDQERKFYEAKGRQAVVDEFKERLGVCWQSLPVNARRFLLRVCEFDYFVAGELASREWKDFDEFDQNRLGHGVFRCFQLSDFLRTVLR